MKTIVTLTVNPAVDINTTTPKVVGEKKLRCARPRREPGGGGLNVSRAIGILGGESTAFYLAGGPTGDILDQLLTEAGVDHRVVETKSWTRENLNVFEETSDQEYRFIMPGPMIESGECAACLEALSGLAPAPDYIVASGSLPPGMGTDFYRRVAERAHAIGARLIVDTSGEALKETVREGAYLLKPNLRELQDLVGRELSDEPAQEAAARELVDGGGCEVLVLSLGAGGVWLITKETSAHIRAPSVPIRSRVGAGDSTVAGTVLALARGMDVPDAVRFGVACGAAAVMTEGTELCRREDAERLYGQMVD
jgi:6-phosphofructokinase 2